MVWPLSTPLYLLSLIYSRAVKARLSLYSRGLLPAKKLPCRVISVGNITVGGSGKTPMTIFLADYLRKKGCRTVVVSRGYGNTLKGRNRCRIGWNEDPPYTEERGGRAVPHGKAAEGCPGGGRG